MGRRSGVEQRAMRPVRALLLTVMLVTASLGGVVTVSQPASADVGEEGCTDDVLGLVTGSMTGSYDDIGTITYSNVRDPCFAANNEVNDVDTKEEARRRIAQLALEDRRYLELYYDQFDANSDRLENPAYLDGKTAFVQALRNGSTETHAVTEARMAVHERTAAQQRALWLQYRSVMDTMEHLALQAEDKNVRGTIHIGTVSGTGTDSELDGGYKLANWSEKDATVNITLTNGEAVTVPAPYKTDNGSVVETLHPLEDQVVVTVYNPDTSSNETIINRLDYSNVVYENSGDVTEDFSTYDENVVRLEGSHSGSGRHQIGQYQIDFKNEYSGYEVEVEDETGTAIFTSEKQSDSDHSWEVDMSGSTPTFTIDGETFDAPDSLTNKTFNATPTTGNGVESLIAYADTGHVDSYDDEFGDRHRQLADADDRVIDALGNETNGYLNDVHNNVDLGNINYSDVYTPYDRYRMSVEPSDIGEQSWLSYQYATLGYGGSNVSNTVTIEIRAGSVVDGTALAANKTVEGQLFTDANPPGGSWQAGQNYTVGSGGDLTTTVYVHRTVTKSYWEDGTKHYETEGETTAISSGEIVVTSIKNSDGATIEEADHTDNEPQNTNVSELTSQINTLQYTIEELRDQIDEDNDGNTPDGGAGGEIEFGLPGFGDVQLPVSSLSVSIAGVALVVGGVVIVLIKL